jgi:NMD protein affecting ribosome stability and mRNA decay
VIKGVTVSRTETRTYLFLCGACHSVLQNNFGAQNKPQLVHILICPSCKHVAGEWLTEKERNHELTAYAASRME